MIAGRACGDRWECHCCVRSARIECAAFLQGIAHRIVAPGQHNCYTIMSERGCTMNTPTNVQDQVGQSQVMPISWMATHWEQRPLQTQAKTTMRAAHWNDSRACHVNGGPFCCPIWRRENARALDLFVVPTSVASGPLTCRQRTGWNGLSAPRSTARGAAPPWRQHQSTDPTDQRVDLRSVD